MKKLFITAAIATVFSISAFADGGKKSTVETGEKNISHSVLNQFNSTFSNAANVEWTLTANSQNVTFTINDVKYTAFYNLVGDYLGLTQEVKYKTLSDFVKNTIADSYKGYDAKEVIKYETQSADEAVVYFVDLKKADSEVVVKVTPDENVSFFKKVK